MKRHASHFLLLTPYSLLLTILLLAAALRFYRLDAQSFWNDEGNSARIAERSLGLILEGAGGDIHPPGYYLLLHYWRALFGQSEFALRSLSIVAGLATVVFTYLLGRHLFDEATGLMAAFLGAISPFAIYYSQEARMYALLAALSVASTFFAIRILRNTQYAIRNTQYVYFTAYVLTSTAGLYTQYAFPFVLLVHNAVFGLWWLTVARRSAHRWRWLTAWGGAQTSVVILYLPWLFAALKSVTGWSSAGGTHELWQALVDVLRVLSAGVTLPVEEATVTLVGATILLLVGLWSRQTDRTGWFGVAGLAIYLLLPIVFIFAFDLYKPSWLKFLVVVLPPFHILIAHGIETLSQSPIPNPQFPIAIRFLFLTSCLLLLAPSLHNLYFNPTYARDDYRQIAADVAALARPGDAARRTDAVILNAPNQWEVFTYYYPDQDVYPAPYRPEPGEVEAFLTSLTERYRRLFVLYWGDAESDPQRLIEMQLASHAYKASDRWYGRVRLATYGVALLPDEPAVVLNAHFGVAEGAAIRLGGYAVVNDRFASGDVLPVTLFWGAQGPIAERYKVTVQLLDGTGQLVAQVDTEPGDGLIPTIVWKTDQVLIDRYGVFLPQDLPPGRYTLIVGLYHLATGERLSVDLNGEFIGDHLSLYSIKVAPPQ